jgi:hypothetical protein
MLGIQFELTMVLMVNRSLHDEQYLAAIRNANTRNPSKLLILDCRAYYSAIANRAKGIYCSIDNSLSVSVFLT